jgi:hypothetical protein
MPEKMASGKLWVERRGRHLAPKKHEFEHDVKLDVEARILAKA